MEKRKGRLERRKCREKHQKVDRKRRSEKDNEKDGCWMRRRGEEWSLNRCGIDPVI